MPDYLAFKTIPLLPSHVLPEARKAGVSGEVTEGDPGDRLKADAIVEDHLRHGSDQRKVLIGIAEA